MIIIHLCGTHGREHSSVTSRVPAFFPLRSKKTASPGCKEAQAFAPAAWGPSRRMRPASSTSRRRASVLQFQVVPNPILF